MNADGYLNIDAMSKDALKHAMGQFATGITVVTTRHDGEDFGMTCNSFNTVSLDPAMVLWSIRKESGSIDAYTKSDGYTVNILSAHQQDVAMKFARGPQAERFAEVRQLRLPSGRLMLPDAAAWFDCEIDQIVSAGDHYILVGKVIRFASAEVTPLAYLNGKFMDITAR